MKPINVSGGLTVLLKVPWPSFWWMTKRPVIFSPSFWPAQVSWGAEAI